MLKPPNRPLLRALTRRFGPPKISRQGEPVRFVYRKDPFDPTRLIPQTVEAGERYVTACPFCGDTRKRLSVSYLFGTEDENGRKRHAGFWRCFNDDECHKKPECRLESELKLYVINQEDMDVVRGPLEAYDLKELREAKMPDGCVPLTDLSRKHRVNRYIEGRGFDPKELYEYWGVVWCPGHANPLVRERIVVPIVQKGKLVGWQARSIEEELPSHIPKYYTMPGLPKSRVVFNMDEAKKYKVAVVDEGVFGVFRIGARGVCIFGPTASTQQTVALREGWDGLVLVPHTDARWTRVWKCSDCRKTFLGRMPGGKCPKCKEPMGKPKMRPKQAGDPDTDVEMEVAKLDASQFKLGVGVLMLPAGVKDVADLSHEDWKAEFAEFRKKERKLFPKE